MTEAEWLACEDPTPMLDFISARASPRKLLLFGVACCRRICHLLSDERSRTAIKMAERFADDLATKEEFDAALRIASEVFAEVKPSDEVWDPMAPYALNANVTSAVYHLGSAEWAASFAAGGAAYQSGAYDQPGWRAGYTRELSGQADLLRDILGTPFRPISIDPTWLSRDGAELIRIAEEIYSENLFSNLPLLADALERAGCSDIKILSHCRKPGQHVRGCWVIDALLRKESGIKIGLTTEADWLLCKDLRPLLHYLCERGSERKWRLFSVACCRRVDHLITDESSRDAVELAERFADGRATEEELAEAHAKAKQEVEESHHAEWMAEAEANFCYTAEYCAVVAVLEVAAAVESVVSLSARPTSTASGMTGTHGFAAGAVASMARSKAYADWGMKSAGVYEACQAAADAAHESEVAHQLLILRDIFGDQFGPVRNESRWLSWSGGSERWSLLPSPRKIDFDRSWLEWNNCIVRKMAKEIYDKRAFDQMHALADALVQAGCTNADILTHCRSGGEHVRGCWVVDLLLGNA